MAETLKPYTYKVTWSAEDEAFIATCDAFPSLSFISPSDNEALLGIEELVAWAVADVAKEKTMYPIDNQTRARIEREFTYQSTQPGQPERYKALREKAKELALLLAESTPNSREQAVALTKLSEVIMWANAAIARNEAEGT